MAAELEQGAGSTGAAQAAPQAAPTQQPSQGAPGPQGGDNPQSLGWRAGLPKEYQNHEAFTRYGKVGDLAKDYLGLMERSQRSIVRPTQESTPEEWAAYRKAMGIPEKPDEYGLEGAHPRVQNLRQAAHEAGMSVEQFKKFLGRLGQDAQGYSKEQTESRQKKLAEMDQALRKEWGDKYDAQRELATRAYKTLVDEGTAQELASMGLLDNPHFIRMMAKAGGALGEGRFVRGGTAPAPERPFMVDYSKTRV